MADFTITVADEDVAEVTDCLAQAGGFPNSTTGETPNVTDATQVVADFITQTVVNIKTSRAHQAALDAIPEIVPPTVTPPGG